MLHNIVSQFFDRALLIYGVSFYIVSILFYFCIHATVSHLEIICYTIFIFSLGREVTKNNKTTGLYAKVCCDVANEMGTQCVDLYTEMMKSEVSTA